VGACPDDRWWVICAIAYYAGLWKGEIMVLGWEEIDFKNNSLHVLNKEDHRTKNRRSRTIPMVNRVVAVLKKLLPGIFQAKHVFRSADGGPTRYNFTNELERIAKRAGLVTKQGKPSFTFQDLRRSCATELFCRGVPAKTVQKIVGHTSLSTMTRYCVAVKDKDMRDAIARLEVQTA